MKSRIRISTAVVFGLAMIAMGCGGTVDQGSTELGVGSTRCVFTQGYWKNQPRWPVSSLHLGTVSYTEAQLRSILATSVAGNGIVELAHQLIAAKLNVASGATSPTLTTAIANADALIGSRVVPPVGTGFLPTSATLALTNQLDSLNSGRTSVQCSSGADLRVAKTVSNTTPTVGDTITYTVTVTNGGPANATGVALTDLLPAGLTFISATPSQGTYNSTTGLWAVGALATSSVATLQIQARVVTLSSQTNTASISQADQPDPVMANNSASATINPSSPRADLAVAKTVSNPTPNVGDTITYTVTVTNLGPNNATNVSATDLLPAGLSFISATPSQGSYNSTTGLWAIGPLTTSTPATLQLQARVASPSSQTNTASISQSDQADPNMANNSGSATISPLQADLAVAKTVSNPTPNVGDTITYTVTLTNNGPGTATNVSVTDLLPAGLIFVSATPSQGTYTTNSGSWAVGTVTTGSPATLQLQATVASPNTQTNTATISHSDEFDPNPANNSASATIVPLQADLAVTKTVSNSTPNVGDTIAYTVTVNNNGPGLATNVAVTDLLPAGLIFVSSTASNGSYNPGTGVWAIGSVTTVTPATLQLQAVVASPNAQTNTAAISHSDEFDPNTSNNSGSATVTPQLADLAVTKTVNNTLPFVGDQIVYMITVANGGPDTATNVAVSDFLPPGVAFVSATPSQGSYNNSTGVWAIGSVNSGSFATLQITALVLSPAAQTNTAAIGHSDQFDPNTVNNSASVSINADAPADLALTKSVNNTAPNVGDTITYTVALTNNGPNGATNVAVTDLLPAGVTLINATPSQGTYTSGNGLWAVGGVTSGSQAVLTISALVVSPNAQTNTASVSHSDQPDPNLANNSASVTITPSQADLSLGKTVNDPTPNVGDTITYTVTLTNNGPSVATNVAVQDFLPAGVIFVSDSASQGSYNPGTGVWAIGTVNSGSQAMLTISARVVSPNTQTNTASVSHSDQFDPNTANNSASATETPQQADLTLTKTVNNTTPNVGDQIIYTLTLTNTGPDTATNVAVQDLLPLGVTFVSASASQGSYSPGIGVWAIGSVSSGSSATLTITATVVSPSAQTNTASVSHADQFDPDTSNNSASVTTNPAQADLALTKSVNNPTPNVGDQIVYTVTLTNNGPGNATNVSVTDVLPAGVAFVSATPSQGSYIPGSGLWSIGGVANGASATLTITATVTSSAAQTNTATISHSDQFDPDTTNNSASVTIN
jgi:uncharacterized repeat protein (TIGR01451 family)